MKKEKKGKDKSSLFKQSSLKFANKLNNADRGGARIPTPSFQIAPPQMNNSLMKTASASAQFRHRSLGSTQIHSNASPMYANASHSIDITDVETGLL